MPREVYQQRLADLREDVLYTGELVAGRLRRALDALDRTDERLAREVIEGDGEINRRYLDLESECTDLLALQQPVAGDLRLVTASFKILTDLERIADLATNLAGYAIEADRPVYPDVDVQRIGAETLSMLEAAMEAYAEEDADACWELAYRDDEVDEMCERASETVVRDLLAAEDVTDDRAEELLPEVRRLLLTVRDLERVGDHAVNVAARTLYVAEGDERMLE